MTFAALLGTATNLFVFLIILSLLVLIHEAGHFFAAKLFGIKVEEFGYGFPPRAWGKKIGETIYSLNWLPIGGFVKLYGEDEAGAGRVNLKAQQKKLKDEDRAFYARPVWQRAVVVVAGVVMNTLLAAAIFYTFLGISGFKTDVVLLSDYHFFGVNEQVKSEVYVSDVMKNSPAEKAGLQETAKIIAINGIPVTDIETFAKTIKNHHGKPVALTWEDPKTHTTHTTTMSPRMNPPKGEGAFGIGFFDLRTAELTYDTPAQKVFSGFTHPINLMIYQFDIMKKLLGIAVKEKNVQPISQGVSGPVGIYSVVGTIVHIPDVKERILQILNLAGLLSISLAFFNVLPIPALDGGRLFFILFEGVTGKKVKPEIENMIHTVGMIVLLGFILLVTFKDVLNLFK